MDYRIISIGALSQHELWNETQPVRSGHATTTLVRTGGKQPKVILVDPGLPAQMIAARLQERTGLAPAAVTDVFLTNFRPAHRRGLPAFEHAHWYVSEIEREFVGRSLVEQYRMERDTKLKQMIEQDIALLQRCKPAPQKLAEQVDLFPCPGFTPGTCGLLVLQASATVLIAGDAVATVEHLERGRVLRGCYDPKQAQDSFVEALEIADVIVPGHDNVVMNPTKRF